MNDPLEFKLVDVFAMSPYTGNVAGVVMNADTLSDAQMQHIAAELSAGATAFILPPTTRDAAIRIRWFSVGCELTMCGHGTLGAVHALLETGRFARELSAPAAVLTIECRAGILQVCIEQQAIQTANQTDQPSRTIWLNMPDPRPKSKHVPLPPLVERLGITLDSLDPQLPPIRTRDEDIILGVSTLQSLLEMSPASAELARYCKLERIRGVFVTTTNVLSRATVTQSRFFCPSIGLDEDTVSGSVHGPLGYHLVECGVVPLVGGKADFLCAQAKAGGRAGIVRVVLTQAASGEKSARIGGACVTTATGVLAALPKA